MSPLAKRLPRELRNNIGKYVGIFLLMCGSIALTSGFLLAAHSITVIIDGMPEAYSIEDGRLTTSFEASQSQLDAAAAAADPVGGVTFYRNYSIDADLPLSGEKGTSDCTLRTYVHRTEVDLAAYCEGRVPEADDEVAIDRVFATNTGIEIGDELELSGRTYTVVGIMTQADSQALFLNNSDFTVNTLTYGVAEVTQDGFDALEAQGVSPAYTYSFLFKNRDLSVADRTDAEKDMVSALSDANARVTDLTDASANQGIGYAADDVTGDSAMWTVLLEIIVAIMAFVFVVLTSGTIEEESAIIGTLLASGYRRRELVLHYLALPSIIGIVAATLGSTLGVTLMTTPMQQLYYGSYSLPPFRVSWDWGIFVQTTVVPVAVLVGITLLGLLRKMGRTPLQFLRHETGGKGGVKRGVRLPECLGFVARFRLRVFLRNLGNFATLFVGIGFASMLLLFSLAILPTMSHYASNLRNNMVADHQYSLKAPIELEGTDSEREAWAAADKLQSIDGQKLQDLEDAADDAEAAADELAASPSLDAMQRAQDAAATLYDRLDVVADDLGMSRDDVLDLVDKVSDLDLDDEEVHPINTYDNGEKIAQAEKYGVYALDYDRGEDAGTESVSIYGVSESSRYWKNLTVGDGRVVLGAGMVDKFGLKPGDTLSLYDKYADAWHEVTYDGTTWGSKSDMSVYMSLANFNDLFDNDADYFNAYASNDELTFDGRYLASDLTPKDMDAIGDQFTGMMDDMIGMMLGLSVFIFLIFMYLLTKAVIDRSARSISYMKVFGYRDAEISKLYIRSITLCVAASLILCMPVIIGTLTLVFRGMLLSYNGNIEIYVPFDAMAKCVLAGFATYLVVALLHTRAIKRVPLSEALKVQE